MLTCPECKKRWYFGFPPPEEPREHEERLARERARGLHWSGGCRPIERCDCGATLIADQGDDDRGPPDRSGAP